MGTPRDRRRDPGAVRAGAADGFVVQALTQPHGFEHFVDLVVPELQRRGLTRTAYEETTLRERLGLARPQRRGRGWVGP